eukprot:m51a1_g3532 hypothetical protein (614) ;mRNA; r:947790-949852
MMLSRCLVLGVLLGTSLARPDFSNVLGMGCTADPSRPLHCEFSGSAPLPTVAETATRSVIAPVSSLVYEVDLLPAARSLDLEMSVDALSCSETFVDITVTNGTALRSWGQSFVFVAGPEWGCPSGVVLRRVSSVHWLSDSLARAMTTAAEYTDVFENAKIHYTLQQPRAQRGQVVIHPNMPRASWNFNSETGKATKPFTFWKAACDMCTADSAIPLCQLCPTGLKLESSIGCDDCWADAGVDTLTVKMEFSLKTLLKFEFELIATSQVQIKGLGISASVGGQLSQLIPIWGMPLFPGSGISFTVAGHQFNIGALFKVDADLSFNAEAAGSLKMSYSKMAELRFYGNTATKQATVTATLKDGPAGNAITPSVRAGITTSAGLRASLSLEVTGLAQLSAWVQPTVSATTKFSYPAFDALPSKELASGGLHFGHCDKFHLIEATSQIGLPVGASARVLNKEWAVTHELFTPLPLVNGCLFNLTTKDPLRARVAQFAQTIEALVPGLSPQAISAGIAHEVAQVLHVNETDVLAVVTAGSKLLPLSVITDDITVSIDLTARLRQLMASKKGAVWSGPIMSKLAPSYQAAEMAYDEGHASVSGVSAAFVTAALLSMFWH